MHRASFERFADGIRFRKIPVFRHFADAATIQIWLILCSVHLL